MSTVKTFAISFVGMLLATIVAVTAVNNGWIASRTVNDLTRLLDQNVQLQSELKRSQSEVNRLERELQSYKEVAASSGKEAETNRIEAEEKAQLLLKARRELEAEKKAVDFEKKFGESRAKTLQDAWDKALWYITGGLDEKAKQEVEWDMLGMLLQQDKATSQSVKFISADFDKHMDAFEARVAQEDRYYYWGNLGDVAFPELYHLAIGHGEGIMSSEEFMRRFNRMRNYVRPDDEKSRSALTTITHIAKIR